MDALVERNALILTDTSTPCPADECGLLAGKLRNHLSFAHVQEFNLGALSRSLCVAPDIVLLRLAGISSRNAGLIGRLKAKWAKSSVLALVCSGAGRFNNETQNLPNGVDDFVLCPYSDCELFLRINRLLGAHTAERSLLRSADKEEDGVGSMIVGKSSAFLRVVDKIPLIAGVTRAVLISGETGSGKEVIARAIHYQGPRKGKPFIPVNCGALPDHLVENELFGHIKGAFTDASSAEKGLIAEAEGGTLFLDEVDALSHAAQIKLLRFLQDHEYRPLGSPKSIVADVRIVAATNVNLAARVQNKLFRDDLYYRLNVLSLSLPPLRERAEDIPLFASYFLNRYGSQYNRALFFSPAALHKLMLYNWPGNVRELEAAIHRAAVLASSSILQAGDIDLPQPDAIKTIAGSGSLHEAKSRAVAEFERSYLAGLLKSHRGNITRAAKAAGKERRSFQRLVQKYRLDRHSFQN